MRAVRTLFISHDGDLAGAQRVLLSTLRGLNRDLVEPYLVVPYQGELEIQACSLGISVSRRAIQPWAPCVANLNGASRIGALKLLAGDFRSRIWAISNLIERLEIDVVYTNTAIVLEGAVAARRTGRSHVWHIHEPIFDNPELLPLLPEWLYSSVIERLADQIIVPSQSLSDKYPSLIAKTNVIYNGIRIPPPVDRDACKRKICRGLGLPDNSLLVGIVGAIQPRKDYSTLIAAAKAVTAQIPSARFIVVGRGSHEHTEHFYSEIDRWHLRHVIFRIPRWEGEIFEFFAGVDLTVVSSIQESFGLTVAESLAVETPVVSTRCGGPEEVIGPVGREFLVNIGDSKSLAESISNLLQHPKTRRELGSRGQTRVRDTFSFESHLQKVSEVLCSAASPKSYAPGHRHTRTQ